MVNTAFLSTVLTLALASALTFAIFLGGGGDGPASSERPLQNSANREIERRLDLAVNGSGPRAIAARPVSSVAATDTAEPLTLPALLGLVGLGGMLMLVRKRLARLARRRRLAFTTASQRLPD